MKPHYMAYAVFAAFLLGGCDIRTQLAWQSACRTEAGVTIHQRPPAANLAMPFQRTRPFPYREEEGLLRFGAASIEVNASTVTRPGFYSEGPGRYRVRLRDELSDACRESLIGLGYDPNTLERTAARSPQFDALSAECFSFERLGDAVPPRGRAHVADYLEQFESEYLFLPYPWADRGGSYDSDGLLRQRDRILRRDTGEAIAESVALSKRATLTPRHFGDPTCYGARASQDDRFPDPVFTRD